MATIGIRKLFKRKARADDTWTVVPGTQGDLDAVVHQCRRMVSRRAAVAAGVAVVPIPGVDWLTDVAVLMKLIPDINHAFGLTAGQVERLAPHRRVVVYKAISAGGGSGTMSRYVGPFLGSNTVTMPSKRKIDPCTTGMRFNNDASFTR